MIKIWRVCRGAGRGQMETEQAPKTARRLETGAKLATFVCLHSLELKRIRESFLSRYSCLDFSLFWRALLELGAGNSSVCRWLPFVLRHLCECLDACERTSAVQVTVVTWLVFTLLVLLWSWDSRLRSPAQGLQAHSSKLLAYTLFGCMEEILLWVMMSYYRLHHSSI